MDTPNYIYLEKDYNTIVYIIIPSANSGSESCVQNSTEIGSLKACDNCIVKVMLPFPSAAE